MVSHSVDADLIWRDFVKSQPQCSQASTSSTISSIPATHRAMKAALGNDSDSSAVFWGGSSVTTDDDRDLCSESDEDRQSLDIRSLMNRVEMRRGDAHRSSLRQHVMSNFQREIHFQRGVRGERRSAAVGDDDQTSIWFESESEQALPRPRILDPHSSVSSQSFREQRVMKKSRIANRVASWRDVHGSWVGSWVRAESGAVGSGGDAGTRSFGPNPIRRAELEGFSGRGGAVASTGRAEEIEKDAIERPGIRLRTVSSFINAFGSAISHCEKLLQNFDEAQEEAPFEDEELSEIDQFQDVGGFDGGVWEQFPPPSLHKVGRLALLRRAGKSICRLY